MAAFKAQSKPKNLSLYIGYSRDERTIVLQQSDGKSSYHGLGHYIRYVYKIYTCIHTYIYINDTVIIMIQITTLKMFI